MPCGEGVLVLRVDAQRSCGPTLAVGVVYPRLVVSDDEVEKFTLLFNVILYFCQKYVLYSVNQEYLPWWDTLYLAMTAKSRKLVP